MANRNGDKGQDNLLPDDLIQSLVFETFGLRRFTQDSPINADIWVRFLKLARLRFLDPKNYNGVIESYRVPLILTPKHTQEADGTPAGHAGLLARKLRQRYTGKEEPGPDDLKAIDYLRIAATSRHVAIDATFYDLIYYLLPLSDWWRRLPDFTLSEEQQKVTEELRKTASIPQVLYQLTNTEAYRFAALTTITHSFLTKVRADLNMEEIIRVLAPNYLATSTERLEDELFGSRPDAGNKQVREKNVELFNWLFTNFSEIRKEIDATRLDKATKERLDKQEFASIWKIHLNRQAFRQDETTESAGKSGRADNSSIVTVKADAARRLFNVKTSHLCWAVIDTGVDARHPVFRDPYDNSRSRVVASLDFTLLQDILSGREEALKTFAMRYAEMHKIDEKDARRKVNELSDNLHDFTRKGYQIDWGLVEQLIRIDPEIVPPTDPHGTHVAGIIAGYLPEPSKESPNGDDHNARKSEYREAVERFGPFTGVCPDIRLYDLRVIKDPQSGEANTKNPVRGDEFVILAALDYIAWKNGDPMRPVIHGVNISLAIPYAVGAHACGHTPVCDACDRLVWNGTVVVAAAGNSGFDENNFQSGLGIGYRDISITDPGNASEVITVGSTHYCEPHTYGVSYFSGRGPTGDGRMKPDVVAPGHKIWSAVPGNEMVILDGTSMAAPHVSGICALIMGRHQELTGEPERIKKILMDTATDLGRERRFQGAGLVDALRALQAV
jgi:serine protease AprX